LWKINKIIIRKTLFGRRVSPKLMDTWRVCNGHKLILSNPIFWEGSKDIMIIKEAFNGLKLNKSKFLNEKYYLKKRILNNSNRIS